MNSHNISKPYILFDVLAQVVKHLSMGLKVACVALVLCACDSNKKVISVDQSADYESAKSLPPLEKSASSPGSVADSTENDLDFDLEDEQIQADTISESLDRIDIAARVISPNPGVSRLLVEAEFPAAWAYLSGNLQRSDLTVFARNESAGRVSIGCEGIETAPIIEERSGWSFFNKEQQKLEYCVLQAVSTEGSTVITVLNRTNEEISGDYAAKIFQRILNN